LSLDGILAAPDIPAVALATPAAGRASLALRAIAAGKHVFLHHALALDLAEMRRIHDAAQAQGRIMMTDYPGPDHPVIEALQALIGRGALGRLRYLYSNDLGTDYQDVLAEPASAAVAMILALADSAPELVTAIGHPAHHGKAPDTATIHLRFAEGLGAHVFVSRLPARPERTLTVIGEAGTAVFDDRAPASRKLTFHPYRMPDSGGLPAPDMRTTEPLAQACRRFLRCIREEPRIDIGVQEAIAALEVLDAARRSMMSGRPVALPQPSTACFVHESAYVDDGAEVGRGTRIWYFSHVFAQAKIGRDCVIGQNVMIGPGAIIGDYCKIQNNVSIYPGVTLEDGVFCGPSCVFTNVINPRAEIERKDEFRPTIVGRGATIGANATIVCGHRIGAHGFIAAGAVVTRDVPAHALMAGSPARRIGWMSRAGYRLNDDLVCPETHERYAPDGQGGLVWTGRLHDAVDPGAAFPDRSR
jgi:predicted dehydrogenase/acetyltransferase-like isoleucine patch superfamily enzyme